MPIRPDIFVGGMIPILSISIIPIIIAAITMRPQTGDTRPLARTTSPRTEIFALLQ